ncbi:MAG: fluoride efflux transporter CrcB [bacterium]|nr:fluoride efflux transporter CrcB [bacterium]
MGRVLLVGLGGFVGSSARFVLSGLVHRALPLSVFPIGTFAVNVLGCLVIGFLGGLMELRQVLGPAQRLFVLIGILGGFTTFSTFAFETLSLAHASDFARAAGNVAGQVLLGLTAAWVGYLAAQYL